MADAALVQLQRAIKRQWSRVPSQKAKPYVNAFFAAVRTDTKITAKAVGNHGTYTVSIQFTNHSLTSACSCYIGKHGSCHHCEALAITFVQDPNVFRSMSSGLSQVAVVQPLANSALAGAAGKGQVQPRLPPPLGLRARRQVMTGAHARQEAPLPWPGGCAEAPQPPQRGREAGPQPLGPRRMARAPGLRLPRLLALVMPRVRARPRAAGRVRREPLARVDGAVRRLLPGLHGAIWGRRDAARGRAADPGDERGPVFIIMASTGLPCGRRPCGCVPPWVACPCGPAGGESAAAAPGPANGRARSEDRAAVRRPHPGDSPSA
jgi:hypothetical protein